MQKRWEEEKKKDVARLKEELLKQKDYELQQVLKYKEDEIRYYRAQTPGAGSKTPMSERSRTPAANTETPRTQRAMSERAHSPDTRPGRQTPGLDSITDEITRVRGSRDHAERTKTPSERTRTPERAGSAAGRLTPMVSREEDRLALSLKESQARVQQLESDMARVRRQRDDLQQQNRDQAAMAEEKERDIARIKDDYEQELRRVIGEYKKVALGNLQKLKLAEHALREGSMTEDDILSMPMASPLPIPRRRSSGPRPASSASNVSIEQIGIAAAGIESGEEGVSSSVCVCVCVCVRVCV
jgi:hypothetical protein